MPLSLFHPILIQLHSYIISGKCFAEPCLALYTAHLLSSLLFPDPTGSDIKHLDGGLGANGFRNF